MPIVKNNTRANHHISSNDCVQANEGARPKFRVNYEAKTIISEYKELDFLRNDINTVIVGPDRVDDSHDRHLNYLSESKKDEPLLRCPHSNLQCPDGTSNIVDMTSSYCSDLPLSEKQRDGKVGPSFSPDMDFLEMDFDPSVAVNEYELSSNMAEPVKSNNMDTYMLSSENYLLPNDSITCQNKCEFPCVNIPCCTGESSKHIQNTTSNSIFSKCNCKVCSADGTYCNVDDSPYCDDFSFTRHNQITGSQLCKVDQTPTYKNLLEISNHCTNIDDESLPGANGHYNQTNNLKHLDHVFLKAGFQEKFIPGTGMNSGNSKSVMIWSESCAESLQIEQIGKSSCGPTALLNVMEALGMKVSVKSICGAVKVRLRNEQAPLVDYLLSRSVAGCDHNDMIKAADVVTEGQVYGKFFHMYPERNVDLTSWLKDWIQRGAVPVMTLNLQKGIPFGMPIADAWHHQMVYGVEPFAVYLTNPLEQVGMNILNQQLCSPSELLIRKDDIISRWNENCNLQNLVQDCSSQWTQLNVLGQVVSMLREVKTLGTCKSDNIDSNRRFSTSHVKIPAVYKSGITLFIKRNNPYADVLKCSDELPCYKL